MKKKTTHITSFGYETKYIDLTNRSYWNFRYKWSVDDVSASERSSNTHRR